MKSPTGVLWSSKTIFLFLYVAAPAVLNALKPGLDEKLYENALVIELRERGHKINQQKLFKVEYKGHEIGRLIPDLIVDDLVIADPKVFSSFNEPHVAQ